MKKDAMSHRTSMTTSILFLVLLSSLALVGCGNVTAGGVSETDVYMSGDGGGQPAPTIQPSRAVAERSLETAPMPAVLILGSLQGDLDVTVSLFLRSEGGSLVPLTPEGPAAVGLDLAGALEPRVAAEPMAAGSYDAMVLRFTDVTADVTGGLVIDGLPFLAPVEVDLGGPSLEVVKPLDLVVDDGVRRELLVDLNADVWIPLLDVLTGVVAGDDFAAAIMVGER